MKNILYASMFVAGMTLCVSCDNEPDFPGLDVNGDVLTNLAKYATTYVGETFSEEAPAKNVIPEWLLKKYYSCDPGSSAMVTYQYLPSVTPEIAAIATSKPYQLAKKKDYKEYVWYHFDVPCFTPSRKVVNYMPNVLGNVIQNPTDKQAVVTDYRISEEEPEFEGSTLEENVENAKIGSREKWVNARVSNSPNKYGWQVRDYANNHYFQISAYNKDNPGELVSYLIYGEKLSVKQGDILTFDLLYANYRKEGGIVKVMVSEDLKSTSFKDVANATWTDITGNLTPATSTSGSGDMMGVQGIDLSAYVGKQVYLAFKYEGDSTVGEDKTTTVRIDNIAIRKNGAKPNRMNYDYELAVFQFNEKAQKWEPFANMDVLSSDDYKTMNESKTMTPSAAEYKLPIYLNLKYPYDEVGAVRAVTFCTKEDKDNGNSYMALQFQKASADTWVSSTQVTEMTDEYVFDGAAWVWKRTVPKAALNETFERESAKKDEPTVLEGWLNVALAEKPWYDRDFNQNVYTEVAAYKANGKVDSWLVTPQLEVKNNYVLTFDMCSGHWTHDALKVYISDKFSGKKEDVKAEDLKAQGWKEITKEFTLPKTEGKYGKFENVGSFKLDAYVGKKVYVAFRYEGDKKAGLTSTVQLDNVYVGE